MTSFYEEFKDKKISQLNEALIDACLKEDIQKVKYLLTSPELNKHARANCHIVTQQHDVLSPLRQACFKGNLEIVKYLLASPELKEHADIHFEEDSALQMACMRGHLNIVKYLLTSPELKEHADVSCAEGVPLRGACMHGHLDLVKYLLETEAFKGKIDMTLSINTTLTMICLAGTIEVSEYLLNRPELCNQKNVNFSLNEACTYGHLELVKFLLHSDKLQYKANIRNKSYLSFNNALVQDEDEILRYFIFDLNIPKNPHIKNYLDNYENKNFTKKIESYFDLREMNKSLHSDLNNQNKKPKKIKI